MAFYTIRNSMIRLIQHCIPGRPSRCWCKHASSCSNLAQWHAV